MQREHIAPDRVNRKMKMIAATLLVVIVGLAGCASPAPTYARPEASPSLDPGAEYPRDHAPAAGDPEPAS